MTQHTTATARADPPLLTVEQAAQRFNVTPGYVRRRLIFERRIPYVKVGRYVRIEPEAVDDFIERGRIEPAARGPVASPVRSIKDIREERLASWRTSESTP